MSELKKWGRFIPQAANIVELAKGNPVAWGNRVLEETTGYTVPKIVQNLAGKIVNPVKDRIAPSLPSIPVAKPSKDYTPKPRKPRRKGGEQLMDLSKGYTPPSTPRRSSKEGGDVPWVSRNSSGMMFPPTE